ncbi:polysaccharide biosynthesis protein [Amnibacterium setariae]|nr:hypothetical protein [Amnibacterium setariae]
MFLFDVAPRIAANLVGLAVAGLTHSVTLYLAIQLVGGVVLVVCSASVVRKRFGRPDRTSVSRLATTLRYQSSGVLSAIAGSAYTNIPIVFVGAVGGARRDEVLFAFRILRIAITGITPLTQFLQGWVPRRDSDVVQQLKRLRIALRLAAATALVMTLGLASLLPAVSSLVTDGQIFVSFDVSAAIAIAVGAIAASQITGLVCLVGLGRERAVAVSTTAGAIAGVALMLAFNAFAAAAGVAWSVAVAETVVLVVQCAALRRAMHSLEQSAMRAAATPGSRRPVEPLAPASPGKRDTASRVS